jgi:hypothetical protein
MENKTLTIQILGRFIDVEPVNAIYPKDVKIFMERIVGTTKYLSNNRKILYDVSFIDLYEYNNKILEGCFAIDKYIYKIDAWASINFPEKFLRILDKKIPESKGICIYLDNKIYAENVPFLKCDDMRDDLLIQRNDGLMWFEVLKIVDKSGNKTLFYPSKQAKKIHEELIKR